MTDRLSQRQIATMKILAVCCSSGNQIALTRDQREAMAPLWRKGIVEVWYRNVPDEGSRGPFYRPSESGWRLINAIFGWVKPSRVPDGRKLAPQ